jgi:hypothetical protein
VTTGGRGEGAMIERIHRRPPRTRLDILPRIRRRAARLIGAGLAGDRPAAEVRDLVAALALLADMVETATPADCGGSAGP